MGKMGENRCHRGKHNLDDSVDHEDEQKKKKWWCEQSCKGSTAVSFLFEITNLNEIANQNEIVTLSIVLLTACRIHFCLIALGQLYESLTHVH